MRARVLALSATALLGGAVHATAYPWNTYVTPVVIDTKTHQEAIEAEQKVRTMTLLGRKQERRWPFDPTTPAGRRLGSAVVRFALTPFVRSKAKCISTRTDRWTCMVSDNGGPAVRITVAVYRSGNAKKILR